jgi:poly-gamma-glutamate synthesis protein (capsule biosynthesis protein)
MGPIYSIGAFISWTVTIWLISVSVNTGYFQKPPAIASKPEYTEATIVAVGDLISHQDVQRAALDAEKGWASLWEEITPIFKRADLAMANLETPIAPKTGKPGIPFCFNASADLPLALKDTGIGLVFTANNHAYDQQAKGLVETLEHLSANGILQAGSGLSRHEAISPAIIALHGEIKVAVLARTDLFNNNLNQGQDRPWVAALDLENDAQIIRELRQDVDAVLISIHWGNEYQTKPSPRQRMAAEALIAAGTDVIIGHHPHVLQPFEWVESGDRRGAVAFSLGNFLSNQHRMYDQTTQSVNQGDNRDGGMLMATLRKGPSGVELHNVSVEPIWTDNNWISFNKRQSQKRSIRVLLTTPGQRGEALESLLATRRERALGVLGIIDQ